MRTRIGAVVIGAVLCLAPLSSWADLAPYSQDFEGLYLEDPDALAGDGWVVYGNVFGPDWSYWYGYGTFPAPNGTGAFSTLVEGEGGSAQGAQQVTIYNDYNNANMHQHPLQPIIEANVFREQWIGAADIGTVWRFKFDARRGNIADGVFAAGFFKTLDPASGWVLTNFIPLDMTATTDEWATYSMFIYIGAELEGQLLQFGFLNQASSYTPSGMFYDNINFGIAPSAVALDIRPGGCPNPFNDGSEGVLPAAVLGSAEFDVSEIDPASVRLQGVAPVMWEYEDEAAYFEGEACSCAETMADGFNDLTLKFDVQDLAGTLDGMQGGMRTFTLTGALFDGTPIEGQDCVVMVGGGRGRPAPSPDAVQGAGLTDLQQTVSQTPDEVAPYDEGRERGTVGGTAARRTRVGTD